jgi:poly(3-hydroxyalkanoate) synthetase
MRSDHPNLWDFAFTAAAAMTEAAREFSDQLSHVFAGEEAAREPLPWTTPNRVRLDLTTMKLREFSSGSAGVPALIVAPFALHTAVIADLAPGHSLVARLLAEGIPRLAVTDWTSATAAMRDLSIDSYLAELNVAVDELGPPVDLIGLCQGGWLALVYAARFPAKVRALVVAAAPVDTARGEATLATLSQATPLAMFRAAVEQGGGRMSGEIIRRAWPRTDGQTRAQARRDLELDDADASPQAEAALARYAAWDRVVVDLPGPYYLEIVDWLFQQNLLARGAFPALGRTIALSAVRHPLTLIAGEADPICPPPQLFAAAGLVGGRQARVVRRLWPGGHVELFIGARNLAGGWREVARWLRAGGRAGRTAIGTLAPPSGSG